MNTGRSSQAKIVNHNSGMGTPSLDTVRTRALELAQIDGRHEFNSLDWIQAKIELHGGHSTDANDNGNPLFATVSERDMLSTDLGHHIQNIRQEDDLNIVEELIAEGMDEAVHEQMLEARKMEENYEL